MRGMSAARGLGRFGCPVEIPVEVLGGKWKLVLAFHLLAGPRRNGELRRLVPGISQKMLTQTLRRMERDGLVTRTVHPVIPPKVEYRLTGLGLSLGGAFCGVWHWAADNLAEIERARAKFDRKARGGE